MLAALTVASALCAPAFAPMTAQAKTLAEFDTEIAAQVAVVQEKDAINAEAQAVLGEMTKWYYQNGAPSDLLQAAVSGEDLGNAINKIEYVSQVYHTYIDKAESAKAARDEAESAKEALEALRKEKASRAKSLENAKQIQFPQSGDNPWSGLYYWTGSVARSGCGLCSYTVAINVLTGSDYTPADMLGIRGDWKGMDGYPDDKTGSHGMTHQEYTKSQFDIETWNISPRLSTLKEELSNGEAVAIVCAHGSAFKNKSGVWRYSGGHFVTIVGYDEEGFHVADSAYNSSEGTDVVYSNSEMQRMLNGTTKLTIYHN